MMQVWLNWSHFQNISGLTSTFWVITVLPPIGLDALNPFSISTTKQSTFWHMVSRHLFVLLLLLLLLQFIHCCCCCCCCCCILAKKESALWHRVSRHFLTYCCCCCCYCLSIVVVLLQLLLFRTIFLFTLGIVHKWLLGYREIRCEGQEIFLIRYIIQSTKTWRHLRLTLILLFQNRITTLLL